MVSCFTNLSCNKSLYSLGRRYNGNYALHNLGNKFLSFCMGYLNTESTKKMPIHRLTQTFIKISKTPVYYSDSQIKTNVGRQA